LNTGDVLTASLNACGVFPLNDIVTRDTASKERKEFSSAPDARAEKTGDLRIISHFFRFQHTDFSRRETRDNSPAIIYLPPRYTHK
jgi:hypothetical protein